MRVPRRHENKVYAQGKANWHGNAEFKIWYEVTDPGKNGLGEVNDAVSKVFGGDNGETYTVTVTPVTDQVTVELANETDKEITLENAGELSVKLNVGNTDGKEGNDYDGSEHLTRIIVEGVPDGVVLTNANAHFIGDGTWVLVIEESDGKMEDTLNQELEFKVHQAVSFTDKQIKITVVSEDAGNGQETTATTEIKLSTSFTHSGEVDNPAEIKQWIQKEDFSPDEDIPFSLSDAITAEIADGVTDNGFTITLTDLPKGSKVEGMTKTNVDDKEVWSVTGAGDNGALKSLLKSIKITPPENWNKNQTDNEFSYNATLTTHVPSGGKAQEKAEIKQEINPVTDDAIISISAEPVAEGQDLAIQIDVSNSADDPNWALIDGKLLYLQVEGGVAGDLYQGESKLEMKKVNSITGLDDDNYYVIELGNSTSIDDLVFTPTNPYAKGGVTIKAWVQGRETDAQNIETTNVSVETAILPANSGYEFAITSATGDESQSATKAADGGNLIEIKVEGNGLKDGTESIETILLKNLPNGFLVYIGNDAETATEAKLSNNAGGESTNTWLLGNQMPNYIGILPPKNWSGTLEGIEFTVISGESSLAEKEESTKEFDLVVNPQADGVEIKPTASFGQEGEIIGFNLNANLKDLHQAGDSDQHVELITLQISGMGDYAAFYVGDELISGTERVIFDETSGTYTIKGLSQDDVDNLGFVQAKDSIDTAGIKVKAQSQEYKVGTDGKPDLNNPAKDADGNDIVSAWTDEKTITTNITSQYGTTGDDELLYTGGFIDGRGGEDTIQLRFGEDVTGSQLADNLKNIEIIDMSGEASGANTITGLTAEDVFNMTDENNILKILGDSEDNIILGEGWHVEDGKYTGTHNGNNIELLIDNNITID